MKKNSRKVLALLLAFVMVLALVPAAALAAEEESTYADTEGSYASSAIERWSGYNVVNGDGTGNFNPTAPATRAEAAAVMSNLLNLTEKADVTAFADLPADAWYTQHFAKAYAAGIFNGTGAATMSPNKTLSFEEYVVAIANALGVKDAADATALDKFSDGSAISGWAAKRVAAMVEAKYISGTADGALGATLMDRQRMVQVVDNLVEFYANEAGTMDITSKRESAGLVLVVADGVKLTGKPSARILVSAKDAAVDLTGLTAKADILVIQDGAKLTGVPAGSTVDFGTEVKAATVNGTAVDPSKLTDGAAFTVPAASTEPAPSTSPAPSTTPAPDAEYAENSYSVYKAGHDVDVAYVTGTDTDVISATFSDVYTVEDDTKTLTGITVTVSVADGYELVGASISGYGSLTFSDNKATISVANLSEGYSTLIITAKKK